MVDRIVPATTPDDIADLAARLGVEDRAMVKTEPFTQWVIEDRFCGPRPAFGAGVQLTAAVAPWEEAKLRLLNGAHSGIAYLGGLAGLAHVHEVLERPEARAFVEQIWDEAQATLSPPPELDIAAYRRALMARFDNPTLMHRTHQIAMDGSQKLPQRLLAPIVARLRAGQGSRRCRWRWRAGSAGRRGGTIRGRVSLWTILWPPLWPKVWPGRVMPLRGSMRCCRWRRSCRRCCARVPCFVPR
jgi:fructuronate reductase